MAAALPAAGTGGDALDEALEAGGGERRSMTGGAAEEAAARVVSASCVRGRSSNAPAAVSASSKPQCRHRALVSNAR